VVVGDQVDDVDGVGDQEEDGGEGVRVPVGALEELLEVGEAALRALELLVLGDSRVGEPRPLVLASLRPPRLGSLPLVWSPCALVGLLSRPSARIRRQLGATL